VKYTIIGREGCKYCTLARDLVEKNGHTYDYVDITGNGVARAVFILAGWHTVPQIFDEKGQWIGGYETVKERLETGRNYVNSN
jgi:glutaredoxin